MERIAQFEKVSFEQYEKDFRNTYRNDLLSDEVMHDAAKKCYNAIELPRRATKGSAGYDFIAPIEMIIEPGESVKVPTGIRVRMDEGWVLQCYPRSGLGFKYRMQLDNSVAIIDEDYYYSDNEGHIFAKFTNDSREGKAIKIKKGDGYMQGIFMQYGITVDDDATATRNGGFGSTDKEK